MSKKKLFKPHSDEKQKEYEREIRLQYGPDSVNQSVKNWNSYSKAQQEAVVEEGNNIYHDLVEAIKDGKRPESRKVQGILARWHEHLRYFYEPTPEILRGLGELYTTHPDFIANFKKIHPDLGEFVKAGIAQYVDDLETAELERMLADDEAARRRLEG
jgi:MerR family transcriptional regulator, thiopeptide resistance regulator